MKDKTTHHDKSPELCHNIINHRSVLVSVEPWNSLICMSQCFMPCFVLFLCCCHVLVSYRQFQNPLLFFYSHLDFLHHITSSHWSPPMHFFALLGYFQSEHPLKYPPKYLRAVVCYRCWTMSHLLECWLSAWYVIYTYFKIIQIFANSTFSMYVLLVCACVYACVCVWESVIFWERPVRWSDTLCQTTHIMTQTHSHNKTIVTDTKPKVSQTSPEHSG